ncbi:MAG: hypothetical protein SFX18_17605 [Pirellulales bacterium]|nr:hypothetical protein [Pirellulales bacterium]
MHARTIIAIVLTFFALTHLSQAQTPRQRIALNGNISKYAIGIPKWASDRSVHNHGEAGDLILLSANSKSNENITVGVYLYYRKIERQGESWVDVSAWASVPASPLGTEWGYRSNTLESAGVWTRFTNTEKTDKAYNIQLFLPYAVIELPEGNYRLRYRIRVWANNQLVDDFYTNEDRLGHLGGTNQFRDGTAICAAIDGPTICEFSLLGTDDEKTVNPVITGEK